MGSDMNDESGNVGGVSGDGRLSDVGDETTTTPASRTTVSYPGGGGETLAVEVPGRIDTVDIGAEIGRGGMGVVFAGWDTVLHRKVAVKFLLGAVPRPDDPHFEQFLKGARAEAAVRHPGIVAVHRAGVIDGTPYMIMDHIDGPTLRDVSKSAGPLDYQAAVKAVWDVASAVEALHDHELVHRDLKPANILFDADGRLSVTDFGLASLRQRGGRDGTPGGTPAYMAPETFSGKSSPQSDVYAMGIMLFELLCGRLPFEGAGDALRHQHSETPLPLGEAGVSVPGALEDVLVRSTHKREIFRYKTAGHFRRALEDALATRDVLDRGGAMLNSLVSCARALDGSRLVPASPEEPPSSSYFERLGELANEKRATNPAVDESAVAVSVSVRRVANSVRVAKPTWGNVLVAPWVWMVRPARAAAVFCDASRGAVTTSFMVALLVGSLATGAVDIWDATYQSRYVRTSTERNSAGRFDYERRVLEQSAGEVWREWHANGWYGRAEGSAVRSAMWLAACLAFVAWVNVHEVSGEGSPASFYGRATRAAIAAVGMICALRVLFGVGYALVTDHFSGRSEWVVTLTESVRSALYGFSAWWVGRAVRSASVPLPPIELPPRCEGCGYDLRHRSERGCCPECGRDVAAFLSPGVGRIGCAWEDRRGLLSWLSTSVRIALSPRRFHGGLIMRRSMRDARGFAWRHYMLAGAAGGVIFGVVVFAGRSLSVASREGIPIAIGLGLAAWVAHRLVSGFAVSSWLLNRMLPDIRWSQRLIEYESAFVWMILFVNVLVVFMSKSIAEFLPGAEQTATSIMTSGNVFAGASVRFLILFVVNSAMLVYWLRRYQKAVRAVRWSNF